MDQGSYNVQLAALKPANNPHPFNEIDALPDYTDNAPALVSAGDESAPDDKAAGAAPEMGGGGATPDITAAADAQGNVRAAIRRAAQQKALPAQPDRRSLLERIFHPRQTSQPNQQQPAGKRPHWPF